MRDESSARNVKFSLFISFQVVEDLISLYVMHRLAIKRIANLKYA